MNTQKITPKRPKGFPDFLPATQALRLHIQNIIRHEATKACFQEISTGAIEYQETLMDVQEDGHTDVSKQMFKFMDNGNRAVALRFDLTIPFARFCAEHLNDITLPFKKLQIGSAWRGENTQKGRYREFVQCDIDIIGVDTLLADVEVIQTMFNMLSQIIPTSMPFTIKVGHREVLNHYMNQFLGVTDFPDQQNILIQLDKLDKIGINGVQTALIGLFPNKSEQSIIEFLEYLSAHRHDIPETIVPRIAFTMQLLQSPTQSPHKVVFDVFLSRGLAYYTGIVFETIIESQKDFGSIASGGRYNNLSQRFLTQQLPGVGGSIGLDRLVAILESAGIGTEQQQSPKVIVCPMESSNEEINQKILTKSFEILNYLREQNCACTIYVKDCKIKNQLKYAQKLNAQFAIIIGETEVAKNVVTIKNLVTFDQINDIDISDILKKLELFPAS